MRGFDYGLATREKLAQTRLRMSLVLPTTNAVAIPFLSLAHALANGGFSLASFIFFLGKDQFLVQNCR